LTPEAAAVVTIVVAYFTAGAASSLGNAAAVGAGEGAATTIAVGTTVTTTTTLTTAGAVISGAVTAGVTALASQAAVAAINNQGDLGRTLHDLGSSASVKNLLTAIVTGGVLGGLNLNPNGLPTAGGGSQEFFTQLGQNLQAGAARAVIGTAINGGSFEKNLKDGLKNAILDTVAAQAANAIGDLTKKDGVLNDFTNKVAHAIAGCMVGAARADNAGGCGAGALGAAIGEFAAETYGRQADTVQFAAMIAGLAVAITGADASQINLGSQAGSNAAANNYLNHTEAAKLNAASKACGTGDAEQCKVAQRLMDASIERDANLVAACKDNPSGTACGAALADFKIAQASYVGTNDIRGGTPAFKYAQQTTQWIPVGSLPDVLPGEVFHGCGGPTNVCVVTSQKDASGNYMFRPATPLEALDESHQLVAVQRDAMIRGAINYGLDVVAVAAGIRAGGPTAPASDVASLRVVNAEILDSSGAVVARQNPVTGAFDAVLPGLPPPPPVPRAAPPAPTGSVATRFLDNVTVVDQRTGQVYIGTVDLQPTYDRVAAGQTGLSRNDGTTYQNRPDRATGKIALPVQPQGYYTEYVIPTPGISGPGPQRLVVGKGGRVITLLTTTLVLFLLKNHESKLSFFFCEN
jgi:filamentous hemagglutinin